MKIKSINNHILYTSETCSELHSPNNSRDRYCPVCQYGLAICEHCGAAESELDIPCRARIVFDASAGEWAIMRLIGSTSEFYCLAPTKNHARELIKQMKGN